MCRSLIKLNITEMVVVVVVLGFYVPPTAKVIPFGDGTLVYSVIRKTHRNSSQTDLCIPCWAQDMSIYF